jgi:hypothetical protein
MNAEVIARVTELKEYIVAIDENVSKRYYKNAINIIGKAKKSMSQKD